MTCFTDSNTDFQKANCRHKNELFCEIVRVYYLLKTPKSKNFTAVVVVVAITLVFGYSVLVRLGKRFSSTAAPFFRECRRARGACLRPNVRMYV